MLSEEQLNLLELRFHSDQKLEQERKGKLAGELGLAPRQVAVWFQNRRAQFRTKTMEEEYARLRSDHVITVAEKCSLETKNKKLKEQSEVGKKIQELSDSKLGYAMFS